MYKYPYIYITSYFLFGWWCNSILTVTRNRNPNPNCCLGDTISGYSSADEKQTKDGDGDTAHENKIGQKEKVADMDDALDKRRIALETAMQTEGLIWINKKDGTAYSVPHGRRINIFEPTVDITTTQAHLHRSILKKVGYIECNNCILYVVHHPIILQKLFHFSG